MKRGVVAALAGGVGAARFLDGLARVLSPERLFVVGNTGDDAEIHGLHVSPDLDTVMYTLAGLAHPERGWGLRGDSFHCLEALGKLGAQTWFQLGDRDLATHLYRTERLRQGAGLSAVTAELAAALGVRSALAPMSDERVRTRICTATGELEFQTWFVKRRARDSVAGVRFEGAEQAAAAPGVLDAIANAEAVIVCPSNPFISIGPILAIPGIRDALRRKRERVAAISPIVGGRALKGPAAHMMKSMKMRPAAAAVARLYADFVGLFVLDEADRTQAEEVESLGMRPVVTNTIMSGARERKALARAAMAALEIAA
ncbi:MAG TPA: 2-phospho-L-lactate transferase [Bryobacteraceae bacterium]|nr:2-phospho-L-lactate transferase [Bryobacteraceae bacterium]